MKRSASAVDLRKRKNYGKIASEESSGSEVELPEVPEIVIRNIARPEGTPPGQRRITFSGSPRRPPIFQQITGGKNALPGPKGPPLKRTQSYTSIPAGKTKIQSLSTADADTQRMWEGEIPIEPTIDELHDIAVEKAKTHIWKHKSKTSEMISVASELAGKKGNTDLEQELAAAAMQENMIEEGINPRANEDPLAVTTNPEHLNEEPGGIFRHPTITLRNFPQNELQSTFGDNQPLSFSFGNKHYGGIIRRYESVPNGFIKHDVIEFDKSNPKIELPQVEYLQDDASGEHLIASLANGAVGSNPHGFIFCFGIRGERVIQKANELTYVSSSTNTMHTNENITANEIIAYFQEWIQYLLNRVGDKLYDRWWLNAEDEIRITHLSFTVMAKEPEGGGCQEDTIQAPAACLMQHLYMVRTKGNNCFFACILKMFPHLFPNDDYPASFEDHTEEDVHNQIEAMRVTHGYNPKNVVYFFPEGKGNEPQLVPMLKKLKLNLRIYGFATKPYRKKGSQMPPKKNPMKIVLRREIMTDCDFPYLNIFYQQRGKLGHYYPIAELDVLEYLKCPKCHNWFFPKKMNTTMQEHIDKCFVCGCGKKMTPNHVCRPNDRLVHFKAHELVKCKKIKVRDKQWEKAYFFDLETFTDAKSGIQHVYSSAWASAKDIMPHVRDKTVLVDVKKVRCEEYYGAGGFDKFVRDIAKVKGNFYAHNGSRFDFWLVIECAIRNNIKVIDIMKEAGSNKIISFQMGEKGICKFYDSYLHLCCSLKKAEVFGGGVYHKTDCDHKLFKDWESVMENRNLCIPYNQTDVIVLADIMLHWDLLWSKIWGCSAFDFLTLPHMSFVAWLEKYVTEDQRNAMKLPPSDIQRRIRRGLFGGRCIPNVPFYESEFSKSEEYDQFEDLTPEERIEIYHKVHSGPRLQYYDTVSQYPFAALNYIPCGTCKEFSENDVRKHQLLVNRRTETKTPDELDLQDRTMYIVDVNGSGASHQLIGFIITRDDKNNTQQDFGFHPDQALSGPILEFAVNMGYKFTVKSGWTWSKKSKLFEEYMKDGFKGKKEAEEQGNIPKRSAHKMSLNSLTGKQTQETHRTTTQIKVGDECFVGKSWKEMISIKGIEPVIMDGKMKAFILTLKKDDEETKPFINGVRILDDARIEVAKFCLALGAITFDGSNPNPRAVNYYGDTDSQILNSDVVDALSDEDKKKYLGSELGQWKMEKDDIYAGVFVAPKTYFFEYLKPKYDKEKKIIDVERIISSRSKGVPQNRDIFKDGEANLSELFGNGINNEFMDNLEGARKDVDLGKPYFYIMPRWVSPLFNVNKAIESDEWWDDFQKEYNVVGKKFLQFRDWMKLITEDYVCVVCYGSFRNYVTLKPKDNEDLEDNAFKVQKIQFGTRTINQTSFWSPEDEHYRRKPIVNSEDYLYSVPKGHQLYQ